MVKIQRNERAKGFIGIPNAKRLEDIISLSRRELRVLVRLLTGHCCLQYHLKNMQLAKSSNCRLCGQSEETAEHILCECDALALPRMKHFKEYVITVNQVRNLKIRNILNFARDSGLEELKF